MYHLSFSSLFGGSSLQDTTKITIVKRELPGLIPTVDNHAEQLLVAILLQALNSFHGEIISDTEETIEIGGNILSFDNSDAFELLKVFLWKPFYEVKSETEFVEIKQIIIRYFEASGNEYED